MATKVLTRALDILVLFPGFAGDAVLHRDIHDPPVLQEITGRENGHGTLGTLILPLHRSGAAVLQVRQD